MLESQKMCMLLILNPDSKHRHVMRDFKIILLWILECTELIVSRKNIVLYYCWVIGSHLKIGIWKATIERRRFIRVNVLLNAEIESAGVTECATAPARCIKHLQLGVSEKVRAARVACNTFFFMSPQKNIQLFHNLHLHNWDRSHQKWKRLRIHN